ncbi:hypothetical protein KIH41_09285 [Litoribacter ruber]|uniref:hypothetical protein n=1 Tax=Litoribacter ruber TaxID=702568 RepID=UPI001BDAB4C4|nr:hypothetical protein [Litoribacter ruber]MBT0811470.1 hypothetical protein [Litoribacter ruber]
MRFSYFFTLLAFMAVGLVMVTKSASSISEDAYYNTPELEGPDGVCLTYILKEATFSAGGNPETDFYFWSVTDSEGFEVYYRDGLGVESITVPFTVLGNYTINVRVARDGNPDFYRESQPFSVIPGPSFALPGVVTLCAGESFALEALNPADPNFSLYTIQWLDAGENIIGTGNTIEVDEPGRYFASISSGFCEAVAEVIVRPSLEVEVTPSTDTACLGATVNYTPDVPISIDWYYQKEGQPARTFIESSFELNLNTNDLEDIGEYIISFEAEDPNRPGCPVSDSFALLVESAPELNITKLSDAESCENPTGSFQIVADTLLENIEVNGEEYGSLEPGEELIIEDLFPMVYTVRAALNGCPVSRSVSIENDNPEDGILFTVSATPQTCSPTGFSDGVLTIDFGGEAQTGTYRVVGPVTRTGSFTDRTNVEVRVPKGEYSVEVGGEDDCISPTSETYLVEGPDQVDFSVPPTIAACEFYEFVPNGDEDLEYTLTYPDGTSITDEIFDIEESGRYSLLGVPTDPDSPLCPRTRTFNVTISSQIEFDINRQLLDCFGNQLYTATLDREFEEVNIQWLASDGSTVLSIDPAFLPPGPGTYYLDVQPRSSSPCPSEPLEFEVVDPIQEVEVSLDGDIFCGTDAFTTLTADFSFEDDYSIDWYFYENGDRVPLIEFFDQMSIDVEMDGTYEVILRNEIGCNLGSATFEVIQSPEIEVSLQDEVGICIELNILPRINPGEFEMYFWSQNGSVISTDPTFAPVEEGNYQLEVWDELGCNAFFDFEVRDLCERLLKYPNALNPLDPEKDFRIFADEVVQEIEVFIYTRQGELVFHCATPNNGPLSPLCIWDGTMNGKNAPIGTYPLVIRFHNAELGIHEEVQHSLVVVN